MGCDNTYSVKRDFERAISKIFEQISKNLGVDEEFLEEYEEQVISEGIEAIDDVEIVMELDEFDEEDIEEHLKECGYFVIKCHSINEQYKIEAFLQKLKNDPYGPMIIL